MKKDFDFYEFAGILLPGSLLLFFIAFSAPSLRQILISDKFGLGEFGLFVILSYTAGHLLQAVGNLWEILFWKTQGGFPTSWVRLRKQNLLSAPQIELLRKSIATKLKLDIVDMSELSAERWRPITRQMYAAVQANKRASRIDVFNGNYGLFRGITSAFLVMQGCVVSLELHPYHKMLVGLLLLEFLSIYRMRRFGEHYARELLVQFLQLDSGKSPLEDK